MRKVKCRTTHKADYLLCKEGRELGILSHIRLCLHKELLHRYAKKLIKAVTHEGLGVGEHVGEGWGENRYLFILFLFFNYMNALSIFKELQIIFN